MLISVGHGRDEISCVFMRSRKVAGATNYSVYFPFHSHRQKSTQKTLILVVSAIKYECENLSLI
jgi:hypothetical protein